MDDAGLANVHGNLVKRLAAEGVIKIRWHPRLDAAPLDLPAEVDLADKVEGMLLGLAIGDALGNTSESMNPVDRRRQHGWIDEYLPNRHAGGRSVGLPSDDSQLAFWTVEHLLSHRRIDPQSLGALFASPDRQIFGGGSTTAKALHRLRSGVPWSASGTPRSSNGALMRIAPVLLPYIKRPSAEIWTDVLCAAHVSHDDELSNVSCVAMIDLLWQLIGMNSPPQANWWIDQWLGVHADIACGATYRPSGDHPPGFCGTAADLVRDFVRPALRDGLEVDAAGEIWHSGAYLLQTVPTVLYILERFGNDPRLAIEQAVNNSRDNDTVAAIVGAAVGALHGLSALPASWTAGLLGRTTHDDDGQVFRLIARAGETFGYGTTPRLRRLANTSG